MTAFRTDINALNKEIAAIAVAGKKLDMRIQEAGVAVAHHFEKNKDTGLVNRLYLALPMGARKTAMASWIMAHMAVVPNMGPTKKEQPFLYSKDKHTDPAAAEGDMWYEHKPDQTPDMVFDLQKAIKGLLAKAGKASEWKGGDRSTLIAMAAAVGIPETDVPQLVEKIASV